MNIEKIVDVINSGGLVISPTDTIYGIMGDALNENVIRRVFVVKHRPLNKPLLLLMDSFEMVEEYTEELSEMERELMQRYWPGLVTFIVKKNDKVSDLITSSKDTVGIRIPDNEDLRKIIKLLGRPVVSTSANITGTSVITNIKLLEKDLVDCIDYIEDGGDIDEVSSCIINVCDNKINILRDGKLASDILKYNEVK